MTKEGVELVTEGQRFEYSLFKNVFLNVDIFPKFLKKIINIGYNYEYEISDFYNNLSKQTIEI